MTMNKKIMYLIMAVVLTFTTPAYADLTQESVSENSSVPSLEEAKAYLENYKATSINSEGEKIVVEYSFKTEDDLEKAARYFVENGEIEFHKAVELSAEEVMNKNEKTVITPRAVEPNSITVTISGDGTHKVKASATYAIASFDTLGAVEYKPTLSYTVIVTDGIITDLKNPSTKIDISSPGGDWDNLRYAEFNTGKRAGMTANYTITKTISAPVGDFDIDRTETDEEYFTVITVLE